ncbi:hypothetical protein ACFFX0_18095 [Citricoccus parietis]|uniref:Uncharacterized protein n=1 Tax=Citricoccus parietis TaxID=592307 RepID=A0ABV5G2Y4_9MICC
MFAVPQLALLHAGLEAVDAALDLGLDLPRLQGLDALLEALELLRVGLTIRARNGLAGHHAEDHEATPDEDGDDGDPCEPGHGLLLLEDGGRGSRCGTRPAGVLLG